MLLTPGSLDQSEAWISGILTNEELSSVQVHRKCCHTDLDTWTKGVRCESKRLRGKRMFLGAPYISTNKKLS